MIVMLSLPYLALPKLSDCYKTIYEILHFNLLKSEDFIRLEIMFD